MSERSRLIWRCRRGIREMDILLQEFIERSYDNLNDEEKAWFEKLLDEPDLDILNWILGKSSPQSDELMHIVSIIRQTKNIQ